MMEEVWYKIRLLRLWEARVAENHSQHQAGRRIGGEKEKRDPCFL